MRSLGYSTVSPLHTTMSRPFYSGRRPAVASPSVVVAKDNNSVLFIDTAVTGDTRIEEKEQEKVDEYQNLARELRRPWKVNK